MTLKAESNVALSAPFPYFGGKSQVTDLVWQAIGDPPHFAESCVGSAAATLKRPIKNSSRLRVEIINDANGLVVNFWRAVRHRPDAVARWCEGPNTELDLLAQGHAVRAAMSDLTDRLRRDAMYSDARLAAWWCRGMSGWLGADYPPVPTTRIKKPKFVPAGIFSHGRRERIRTIFEQLSNRLRHAIILCGDWERSFCGFQLRTKEFGIFLDPPYPYAVEVAARFYGCSPNISPRIERFCRENGRRPNVRIVLAGREGDYELPGWKQIAWRRRKGYAQCDDADGERANERLWLSPHCLPVDLPAGSPRNAPVWAVSRPRRRAGRPAERRRHAPDRRD